MKFQNFGSKATLAKEIWIEEGDKVISYGYNKYAFSPVSDGILIIYRVESTALNTLYVVTGKETFQIKDGELLFQAYDENIQTREWSLSTRSVVKSNNSKMLEYLSELGYNRDLEPIEQIKDGEMT